MTAAEARVAIRFNSIVLHKRINVRGYVYCLSWVHLKDKTPYLSVGCHDLRANSVFAGELKDLEVVEWNAPDFMVRDLIQKEEEKESKQ